MLIYFLFFVNEKITKRNKKEILKNIKIKIKISSQ